MSDTVNKKLPAHELLVQRLESELQTIQDGARAAPGMPFDAYTRATLLLDLLGSVVIPKQHRSETIQRLDGIQARYVSVTNQSPLLPPLLVTLGDIIVDIMTGRDKPTDK